MRLRGEMWWIDADGDTLEADLIEFVATPQGIAFAAENTSERMKWQGTLRRVASAYGAMTCSGTVTLRDFDGTVLDGAIHAQCTFGKNGAIYVLEGTWVERDPPSVEGWRAELTEALPERPS